MKTLWATIRATLIGSSTKPPFSGRIPPHLAVEHASRRYALCLIVAHNSNCVSRLHMLLLRGRLRIRYHSRPYRHLRMSCHGCHTAGCALTPLRATSTQTAKTKAFITISTAYSYRIPHHGQDQCKGCPSETGLPALSGIEPVTDISSVGRTTGYIRPEHSSIIA
jgi:hypothetical protein